MLMVLRLQQIARRHWPGLAAIALLWGIMAALFCQVWQRTQGHLIYPLDDTYIHMAMAKNLARDGVWGITRYAFSSSSSSPAWTALLSLIYWAVGVRDGVPFVLNLLLGSLLLFSMESIFHAVGLAAAKRFMLLVAVILLYPLPFVTLTSMEHLLHAILAVWFVFLIGQIISEEKRSLRDRRFLLACLLGALMVMARYEGLFAAAIACLLLLIRRRVGHAAALGLASLFLIGLYGAYSRAQGSYWLPNSILVKGAAIHMIAPRGLVDLLPAAIEHLYSVPHVLLPALVICAELAWLANRRALRWSAPIGMAILFAGILCLHMSLVPFYSDLWSLRYDGYLVALGFLAVGCLWSEITTARARSEGRVKEWLSLPSRMVVGLPAVFLVGKILILAIRFPGIGSVALAPRASANIYEQQYQMGLFFRQLPAGTTVALNDIGAANYLADIHCLDLMGLGSIEIARRRLSTHFRPEDLAAITRTTGVQLVAIYDTWFLVDGRGRYGSDPLFFRDSHHLRNGVPSAWKPIGQWALRQNIICGYDMVTFYAADPRSEAGLRTRLSAFQAGLPATVFCSGQL